MNVNMTIHKKEVEYIKTTLNVFNVILLAVYKLGEKLYASLRI